MKNFKIWKLVIPVVLCNFGGFAASVFTIPSIPTWYAVLVKPWFTPPSWVFAPAWTILYTLMGVSFFFAWSKWKNMKQSKWMRGSKPHSKVSIMRQSTSAFAMFDVQFFFNILWSIVFFGMKSTYLGFVVILLLWLSILGNIILFYRIDKKAGWLLVPYMLWVSFATLLNYSVLLLN